MNISVGSPAPLATKADLAAVLAARPAVLQQGSQVANVVLKNADPSQQAGAVASGSSVDMYL